MQLGTGLTVEYVSHQTVWLGVLPTRFSHDNLACSLQSQELLLLCILGPTAVS